MRMGCYMYTYNVMHVHLFAQNRRASLFEFGLKFRGGRRRPYAGRAEAFPVQPSACACGGWLYGH